MQRANSNVASIAAVVACALLLPLEASAGWTRQYQGMNQQGGFLDVWAVSPSFAAAVGVIKQGQDKPVVMIAKDGKTWEMRFPHQPVGPLDIQIYSSVYFIDDKNGFVGAMGMIYATTDGGGTWQPANLGGLLAGPINDIHSAAPASGVFAATSKGELRRTTDGKTWPVLAEPLDGTALSQVLFVDDKHGWVTAGSAEIDEETKEVRGYKDGGLAVTDDGGTTWTKVFSGEQRQIRDISFVDATHGWMVSRSMEGSQLRATTDGGHTWSDLTAPQDAKPGKVSDLVRVCFFDRCEGWLMGSTGENGVGLLWHSVDGGKSWSEVEDRAFLELGKLLGLPIQADLVAFHFANREVGWAGGTYETLFRYDADGPAPACADNPPKGGDGGGGNGGEGGGCSCALSSASTSASASMSTSTSMSAQDGGQGAALALLIAITIVLGIGLRRATGHASHRRLPN